ncbi:hypothetical protein AAP_04251 [Ascosphaera apis ARSEF 7405]|uniref:Uncharacterized protein n=1 Tax=Ascosphaera apis ARSEF 7405 TaxID=392613 RepID=A0A167X0W6_9EURO|nr:hypothetical protein AAP_04251 [Ascosphaera apis ARSEF 7405]
MRRILLCDTPAEFLQYILNLDEARHSYVNLVICCDRHLFLRRLVGCLKHVQTEGDVDEGQSLLSNTLDNIARSQNVGIAFCPTTAHLMAYLGTYRSGGRSTSEMAQHQGVLAILDPLTPLSKGGGLSAQRVSKIFAVAVQVACNERTRLMICQSDSIRFKGETFSGTDSWTVSIPLLDSDSLDDEEYDDVTTNVNRVVQRWFEFERVGIRNDT